MRNQNIDFFRTLLMLLIVLWHSITHGIYMSNNVDLHSLSSTGLLNYCLIQPIAYLSHTPVNCFILITGYFSIRSKGTNYLRVFQLYTHVFFYSTIIYILYLIGGGVNSHLHELLDVIFPLTTSQYWFFSSYIPLILISKYLSKMMIANTKRENTLLILVLSFFTLSFINIKNIDFPPGRLQTDGFKISSGLLFYTYMEPISDFMNHLRTNLVSRLYCFL